ncbi:MAG: hypothetical protein HYZ54_14885 [Ignavibacteriae bacterium]|nr:hypothetical protein [Ignavibacteriota bacterium]
MGLFDQWDKFFSSAFSQEAIKMSDSASAHVNPGTGLPMAQGGIDIGGNVFGASNMMNNPFNNSFSSHNPFNQFPR